MKKILITGGNGFFASRLSKYYNNKYEIHALGKQDLNITDENNVMGTFEKFRPDYVIHTAAIAVTDFCNKHPEIAHEINVQGAVNVANGCKKVNAKMIFMSTEQIFNGNEESGPYDEESKAVPDTEYGRNKLEAEGLLKNILDELWVLRFTWMFGAPERALSINANIIWDTVKDILKGQKIKAPIHEYRGMTYIQDVIESFDKIFEIPYGIYHIGSMNDLSRFEVVKLIIEEMGLANRMDEILIKDKEKYKNHARDVRLNTNKLSEAGISFTSTEDAIRRCISDYSLKIQ